MSLSWLGTGTLSKSDGIKKNVKSYYFVCTTRFVNNLHQIRPRSNIGNPNILKVFRSKKSKGLTLTDRA